MKIRVDEARSMLVSHREHLCYELYEWRDERAVKSGRHSGSTAAAGWVRTGKYPGDLPAGLELILERCTTLSIQERSRLADAVRRMRQARALLAERVFEEWLPSRRANCGVNGRPLGAVATSDDPMVVFEATRPQALTGRCASSRDPEIVVAGLGMRLTVHKDGQCYELFRHQPRRTVAKGNYAGLTVPAGWVRTGFFPTSVGQGMTKMLDLALNSMPDSVNSVEQAVRLYESAGAMLIDAKWSGSALIEVDAALCA